VTLDAFLSVDAVPLATALLAATLCATLGNWLVLRRQAMLGDATAHAVLPGIVLAFLLTGGRDPLLLLLGAAAAGIVAAILAEGLRRLARVESGAALGAAFTVAFALGVYLLEAGSLRNVDLDPDCVVFGSLESLFWIPPRGNGHLSGAGLAALPGEFLTLLAVAAIALPLERFARGRLAIASFDASFATVAGLRPARLGQALVVATAAAAVASFAAVGSILVVALLVVPPAAARFWTDRLATQARLSVAFGMLAALVGYAGAALLGVNAAGSIATATGAILALSVVASPERGVIAEALRRRRLAVRLASEDLLVLLRRAEELKAGGAATATLVAAGDDDAAARRGLARLAANGLVARSAEGTWRLTPSGRDAANEILDRHRRWEAWLVDRSGLAPDHVHETAHRLEHLPTAPPRG